MTGVPAPRAPRASAGGVGLPEVVRLLEDSRDAIRDVKAVVDAFPDRMDERYHRRDVIDARFGAITDRLNRADAWRLAHGASLLAVAGGVIASFVFPH